MTHNAKKVVPPSWRPECWTCCKWGAGKHGLECSMWIDPGTIGTLDLDDKGRCRQHGDHEPMDGKEGRGGFLPVLGRPVADAGPKARIISVRDKRFFEGGGGLL